MLQKASRLHRTPARFVSLLSSICAAVFVISSPLHAQDAESYLRNLQQLAAQQSELSAQRATTPRAATVGITGGFGLPHGTIGFGAALTNQRDRRAGGNADGSAAISAGFGNARDFVGVELTLGLVSTELPWRRVQNYAVLGEDGNLSVKLFREFHHGESGRVSALAIGASNVVSWGDPSQIATNYFVAGSTTFSVPWFNGDTRPSVATLGAGTAVKNQERDPGIFAGVGLGLNSWASVGLSWAGDEAIAGMTFFPKISNKLDLQIGVSYADITRRVSSGRVNLSVSVVFNDLY
ncbi:MAG: hypothetical protein ACNA7L_00355 [Roseinatronobacter sp.]